MLGITASGVAFGLLGVTMLALIVGLLWVTDGRLALLARTVTWWSQSGGMWHTLDTSMYFQPKWPSHTLWQLFRAATAWSRVTPTLIFVGMPKAASTSMSELLGRHPHVLSVMPKEIHLHNGRNIFRSEFQFDKMYRAYFPTYMEVKWREWMNGQAPQVMSTDISLIHSAWVIAPLKAALQPTAKLVLLLRDPVTRAYSAHRFISTKIDHSGKGLSIPVEKRDFNTICRDQQQKWRPGGKFQLLRKRCVEQKSLAPAMHLVKALHRNTIDWYDFFFPLFFRWPIKKWIQVFGKERVLLHDEIEFTATTKSPQRAVNIICNFAGLVPFDAPHLPKKNLGSCKQSKSAVEILDLLEPQVRASVLKQCLALNKELNKLGFTKATEWSASYG